MADQDPQPYSIQNADTMPVATPSIGAEPATNGLTRRPFHPSSSNRSVTFADQNDQSALTSRYNYYNRLDPRGNSSLIMPDHIVPAHFFSVLPFQEPETKQSSIVTIFSIWNTMVGTSLLSLPWAFSQAGFALGLFVILFMAALCFYTAVRVVQSPRRIQTLEDSDKLVEFNDVCRYHYGRWGERASLFFSISTLLGATIVYWVLMSNFLYFTGEAIYDSITQNSSMSLIKNDSLQCDVLCVRDGFQQQMEEEGKPTDRFHQFWHLQHSVPLFLVVLVFPLLSFESPTFFTKFNGMGTLAIFFLIVFVSVKAGECGFNLQFSNPKLPDYAPLASSRFVALSGILSLSFFIHNCILSILRNQKSPENNVRDLSVAYGLVTTTYVLVAVLFYAMFPLVKSCIADNLLNNFGGLDLFSSVARFFLLFQMTTVYPLLVFIIRVQLLSWLCGKAYPSLRHVLGLNIIVVSACVLFAIWVPQVGKIIGFTGSFSGLAFIFTLPCMVYMAEEYLKGRLTRLKSLVHVTIIIFGCLNFIGQFFV